MKETVVRKERHTEDTGNGVHKALRMQTAFACIPALGQNIVQYVELLQNGVA